MIRRKQPENNIMDFGFGLNNFVTGTTAIEQAIKAKLLQVKGEWFLDSTVGISYIDEFSKKPPDLSVLEAEIKAVVLETPGVIKLTSFKANTDAGLRKLSVEVTVQTKFSTQPIVVSL